MSKKSRKSCGKPSPDLLVKEWGKELNSKNSAFLNKKYLESLGSPNSIIGRENEVKQIMKLLDCQDNYFSPVVSV